MFSFLPGTSFWKYFNWLAMGIIIFLFFRRKYKQGYHLLVVLIFDDIIDVLLFCPTACVFEEISRELFASFKSYSKDTENDVGH